MRSGSLCTGYGGLTLAVEDALGCTPAWFAEHEPATEKAPKPPRAAARVLAHRWPNVPNLGDIRRDWSDVAEVDVVDAGYPCQGESAVGKRLGMDDPRWMWPAYFDLIREMRPKVAVGENVDRHLRASFRWVLADLQSIGYAVVWAIVTASDVGACHKRARLWWLAWDERMGEPAGLPIAPFAVLTSGRWLEPAGIFGDGPDLDKLPNAGAAYAGAAYAGAAYAGAAYAGAEPHPSLLKTPTAQLAINGGSQHPDKRREGGHGPTLADQVEHLFPTPRVTDTNGAGHHGDGGLDLRTAVTLLPTPDATHGRKDSRTGPLLAGAVELLPTPTATRLGSLSSPSLEQSIEIAQGVLPREFTSWDEAPPSWQPGTDGGRWGVYAAAIARQEALTRPAPDPTVAGPKGGRRLSSRFVEWMMWMPDGWFTDVPGVTHSQALKLGGNGVVRAQGAAAIRYLAARVPAGVWRVAA